jgi:integrase
VPRKKEPEGRSTSKRAIFDTKVQEALLTGADPVTELAPIWLMMKTGMHPENLKRLTKNSIEHDEQGWWLQFKRAKNDKPRRELLPDKIGPVIDEWIRRRGRPKTHQGYWDMARRVGLRIGLKGISPMTLRHTACIIFLRQYRDHTDRLMLIATRMGCSQDIVAKNYIDMDEWERTR